MRRTFFLVDSIDHLRSRTVNAVTVKQTNTFHSILSTGTKNEILAHNLSCFCKSCLQGKYDSCSNKRYVNAWVRKTVGQTPSVKKSDKLTLLGNKEENTDVAFEILPNDALIPEAYYAVYYSHPIPTLYRGKVFDSFFRCKKFLNTHTHTHTHSNEISNKFSIWKICLAKATRS